MPRSPALIKLASRTHVFWYRISGGLLGSWAPPRRRILLLTTKGRKSGRSHTTPLQYFQDGDNLIVIASNGGNVNHPAWWLNLAADPAATVQLGMSRRQVRAEEATGEERERLWKQVTDRDAVYLGYAKETKRQIPVVVLRPAA